MKHLVLLGIFMVMCVSVATAQSIYLRPNATQNEGENGTQTSRSKIYLSPNPTLNQQRSGVAVTAPNVIVPQTQTVSVVFRNNLEPYKSFSGLDPSKLYAFGDLPDNVEEMKKIAAASDVPRVKVALEMQKNLNRVQPVPKIPEIGSQKTVGVYSARVPAQETKNAAKAEPKKKLIYNAPKSKSKSSTWKLWGTNR